MKKIQAILFVLIIICVFVLIIRNVFFEKNVENIAGDIVDDVKNTEITLQVSEVGKVDYYRQRSIQNTFWIELMARLWNKFPEERKWLKKYIQAMVDSSESNKIDESKDIIINLE